MFRLFNSKKRNAKKQKERVQRGMRAFESESPNPYQSKDPTVPRAHTRISPELNVGATAAIGEREHRKKNGIFKRPFTNASEVSANTAGGELVVPPQTRKQALAEKLKKGTGIILGASALAAAGYGVHKGRKALANRKKRKDAGQKRGRRG